MQFVIKSTEGDHNTSLTNFNLVTIQTFTIQLPQTFDIETHSYIAFRQVIIRWSVYYTWKNMRHACMRTHKCIFTWYTDALIWNIVGQSVDIWISNPPPKLTLYSYPSLAPLYDVKICRCAPSWLVLGSLILLLTGKETQLIHLSQHYTVIKYTL